MEKRVAEGIPAYIYDLMDTLDRSGRRGHPVGGCVRDLLLGKKPDDFDMTSDAPPEELMRIFAAYRVIPTGLAHGTVTVLAEGHPVEITTHRTDGAYTDGRHPDAVSFTSSLTEDLARRDFTVNAMAFDREKGIIDPFGGKNDLKNGIIRAVGDPYRRFEEDALRILRCFRFAAKLEFQIEENTAAAAAALAPRLSQIAVERILTELCKLLEAAGAVNALNAMAKASVLPYVFGDTLPNTAYFPALSLLPPEAALRLAALLADHTPEDARALCRRLHAPNAFGDRVSGYLTAYGEPAPVDPYTARRFTCRHFGFEEGALLLRQALRDEDMTAPLQLVRQVRRDRTAIELRRLAVNGRDLQETVGIAPKETGKLLAYLQDQVWQEPIRNKKQVLLDLARQYIRQGGL